MHLNGGLEGRCLVVEVAAEEPFQLAPVALHHLGAGVSTGSQGFAVGVQHGVDTDLRGLAQDVRVDVGIEGRRDAAGEDKPVACVEPVPQAGAELVDIPDLGGRPGVAEDSVDMPGLINDRDVGPSLAAGVHEVGGMP
jgi:hypothetical protein